MRETNALFGVTDLEHEMSTFSNTREGRRGEGRRKLKSSKIMDRYVINKTMTVNDSINKIYKDE